MSNELPCAECCHVRVRVKKVLVAAGATSKNKGMVRNDLIDGVIAVYNKEGCVDESCEAKIRRCVGENIKQNKGIYKNEETRKVYYLKSKDDTSLDC